MWRNLAKFDDKIIQVNNQLLRGHQNVDQCGENDEFGESDKVDEISPTAYF